MNDNPLKLWMADDRGETPKAEIRYQDCYEPPVSAEPFTVEFSDVVFNGEPGELESYVEPGVVVRFSYERAIRHFDGRIELVNCRLIEDNTE